MARHLVLQHRHRGYTAGSPLGQKPFVAIVIAKVGRSFCMSRLIIILVAIIVLIGGVMAGLASMSSEKPVKHVEKVVKLEDLKK